ncbi:hypothetical protein QN277_010336 [Acacia crassicarpa]|uniref:Uncharacterized protein n=1 Tax=Acacia crassicarpa TaxID=499986 RepID=A0AAE1IQP4_9FABA|nr:hypothetical protein QN277_010336 [Acacia crassicarpa]
MARRNLYMRFSCSTGDAMRMNMVSKGVQNVLDFLQNDFLDMDVIGISGHGSVGAHHYNKDGSVNNSRCTSIAWIPGGDGAFVVTHADGNLYVYEKNKDGAGDSSFPIIKDQAQFSISHARYSKGKDEAYNFNSSIVNFQFL